jgi:hypothetical protein
MMTAQLGSPGVVETLLSCRAPSADITTMSVNVPPISMATLIDDSIARAYLEVERNRKDVDDRTTPFMAFRPPEHLESDTEPSKAWLAAADRRKGDVKIG